MVLFSGVGSLVFMLGKYMFPDEQDNGKAVTIMLAMQLFYNWTPVNIFLKCIYISDLLLSSKYAAKFSSPIYDSSRWTSLCWESKG